MEEAHPTVVAVEDGEEIVEDGEEIVEDGDGHPMLVAVLPLLAVCTCHDLRAQTTPFALSTRMVTAPQADRRPRMRNSMKLITILLLMKRMK
jgi:hypothetical protein